jgi:hypothetical protein
MMRIPQIRKLLDMPQLKDHSLFPLSCTARTRRRFVPIALLMTLLAGGCQSMRMDQEELTWQALHAVDVAQTLNAANDPCYREEDWLTKRMIGEQPSDGSVLLWGVGTAVLHKVVGDYLDRRDAPGWVQKMWDYGSISHKGLTVMSNHSNGVRPWGDNQFVRGCSR